jgi:hypothetical protein
MESLSTGSRTVATSNRALRHSAWGCALAASVSERCRCAILTIK